MDKEQQIQEMAVIGCVRNPQAHTAEECAKCDFKNGQCNSYRHAEALYNAGYRKVGSDAKGNLIKIQNLCIEFDEMGYEPTTLCENPEQTAKKWKSDLMFEIGLFLDESMGIKARYNELKAENERLKTQLQQANAGIVNCSGCHLVELNAVKEFAEKLKEKFDGYDATSYNGYKEGFHDLQEEIDKLLKEYEQ